MVHSRTERLFIFEHQFTPKSFAAVREAFRSAHPDKDIPNKTKLQWLVAEFRGTGSVCGRKHVQCRTVLADATPRSVEETLKTSRLCCYIGVTSAYKYCCCKVFVLSGTSVFPFHPGFPSSSVVFHRIEVWNCTCMSPYVFMMCCLIMHTENFTFKIIVRNKYSTLLGHDEILLGFCRRFSRSREVLTRTVLVWNSVCFHQHFARLPERVGCCK
jgi:hypothetical protein